MNNSTVANLYRESAALGADGTGIVVLLYDRLAQDIQRAIMAMNINDVQDRTTQINHALLVLQQLQGRLDFAAGGPAAHQLNTFYSHIRGKLLEAQIKASPKILLEQAEAVIKIRECWVEIERSERPHQATGSVTSTPTAPSPESGLATMRWGS